MIRLPKLSDLPIIGDLPFRPSAWQEAFKELFIILLFSLMPVWLGLIIVTILTIADGPQDFLSKFASSSDLGILSASLLGPLLYMIFRGDNSQRTTIAFPSGLWITVLIFVCCAIATVIYCFTYLSETGSFFDKSGSIVHFINSYSVACFSWILLFVSSLLVLFASAIRNSMEGQNIPELMREDTEQYISEMEAEINIESGPETANADTEALINALQAHRDSDATPS